MSISRRKGMLIRWLKIASPIDYWSHWQSFRRSNQRRLTTNPPLVGIPVTRVSYIRRGGWVDLIISIISISISISISIISINQAQQAAASAQQNCCYASSLVWLIPAVTAMIHPQPPPSPLSVFWTIAVFGDVVSNYGVAIGRGRGETLGK